MEFPATLGRDLLVWGLFWSVYSRLQPGAEDEMLSTAGCTWAPLLFLVAFVLDQYPRDGASVLLHGCPLIWALGNLYGVLYPQLSAGLLWRFLLLTFLVCKTAFDMCVWALRLDVR